VRVCVVESERLEENRVVEDGNDGRAGASNSGSCKDGEEISGVECAIETLVLGAAFVGCFLP